MQKHNRYILPDGRVIGTFYGIGGICVAGCLGPNGRIDRYKSKHLSPHPDREHVQAQLDVWAQCKRLKKIEVYE